MSDQDGQIPRQNVPSATKPEKRSTVLKERWLGVRNQRDAIAEEFVKAMNVTEDNTPLYEQVRGGAIVLERMIFDASSTQDEYHRMVYQRLLSIREEIAKNQLTLTTQIIQNRLAEWFQVTPKNETPSDVFEFQASQDAKGNVETPKNK